MSKFFAAFETADDRIFKEFTAKDFDDAFNVCMMFEKTLSRKHGHIEMCGLAKSANELAEDLFCTDHDC